MATTYTLTKVEPFIGEGNQYAASGGSSSAASSEFLAGSDATQGGKVYKYTCIDNSSPAKTIIIISPDANLLTPGNNHISGTNTGSIVITDTPG